MEKVRESLSSLLSSSSGDGERYLPVEEDEGTRRRESDDEPQRHQQISKPAHPRLQQLLLGLVFYVLGMLTAWTILRSNRPAPSNVSHISWSPVQHVAEYETRIAFPNDDGTLTGWNGPPTPATNESWFKIADRKAMLLPKEDLERAGEDLSNAVKMKNGNYLTTFAVFHDLHCLETMRWYAYRDHFYPNRTAEQEEGLIEHFDHCLDTIRAATMCTGDLSPYTYRLVHKEGKAKLESKTKATRKCIKLDPIMDWVAKHEMPRYMAGGLP